MQSVFDQNIVTWHMTKIRKKKKISNEQPNFIPQGTTKNRNKLSTKLSEKRKQQKSEIKTRKAIENINKIKNWLFGKINKMDKLLARLAKKKERTHK